MGVFIRNAALQKMNEMDEDSVKQANAPFKYWIQDKWAMYDSPAQNEREFRKFSRKRIDEEVHAVIPGATYVDQNKPRTVDTLWDGKKKPSEFWSPPAFVKNAVEGPDCGFGGECFKLGESQIPTWAEDGPQPGSIAYFEPQGLLMDNSNQNQSGIRSELEQEIENTIDHLHGLVHQLEDSDYNVHNDAWSLNTKNSTNTESIAQGEKSADNENGEKSIIKDMNENIQNVNADPLGEPLFRSRFARRRGPRYDKKVAIPNKRHTNPERHPPSLRGEEPEAQGFQSHEEERVYSKEFRDKFESFLRYDIRDGHLGATLEVSSNVIKSILDDDNKIRDALKLFNVEELRIPNVQVDFK